MSLASLDRAKDFVKGSLKALNIGASMEHRMECEQPILESSSSNASVNKEVSKIIPKMYCVILRDLRDRHACT